MGVKHGNLADAQVEKSGSPPAILGVRMPGLPLNLYTDIVQPGLNNGLLHFCLSSHKQHFINISFSLLDSLNNPQSGNLILLSQ